MKIGKTEVQQHKLHQQKKLISICDVENYKALECDKVSFDKKGFKYSNGYKDSIG